VTSAATGLVGRTSAASTPVPAKHFAENRAPWQLFLFATSFAWINTIGQFYLLEIVLLFAAVMGTVRPRGLRLQREPRRLLLLGLAWLWCQVLSDLLHGSSFHDYARGWLRIVFLMTNLIGAWILLRGNQHRLKFAVFGLAVGSVAGFFLQPTTYSHGEPWKFGFALPITLAVAVLASSGSAHRRALPAIAFAALGAVHLVLNFRSLGGICLVTAVYLFVARPRVAGRGGSPSGRALAFLLIATAAIGIAVNVYLGLASTGTLGMRAQQKYELQGTGRYGVLLGGRPEVLLSFRAIADSPLIGHGSFAGLSDDNTLRVASTLRQFGYVELSSVLAAQGTARTHSHLFGAWVEAGLAGALFWIAVALLAIRSLLHGLREPHALTVLAGFTSMNLLWDVLFSPFGADRRIFVPVMILVLVASIDATHVQGRSS
jgi:hypothetical protein